MNKSRIELKHEFDMLRSEYIRLMNDKEVLLNWGKPQLEALYLTRIGIHQLERLQMQLRIQALKRKIELVQAAINKSQEFDVTEIEIQVADELSRAEQQIMHDTASIE